MLKSVFFTALAIGLAAAVKQQKPQLTAHGVEARDRRCPLEFDNQNAILYPHETDGTRYYICVENGTLVTLRCPDGMEFDEYFSVRIHTHTRARIPLFAAFDLIESNAVEACRAQTEWKIRLKYFFVVSLKNRFAFGQMTTATAATALSSGLVDFERRKMVTIIDRWVKSIRNVALCIVRSQKKRNNFLFSHFCRFVASLRSQHKSIRNAHPRRMDICFRITRIIASHFSNATLVTRIKFYAAKDCSSTS